MAEPFSILPDTETVTGPAERNLVARQKAAEEVANQTVGVFDPRDETTVQVPRDQAEILKGLGYTVGDQAAETREIYSSPGAKLDVLAHSVANTATLGVYDTYARVLGATDYLKTEHAMAAENSKTALAGTVIGGFASAPFRELNPVGLGLAAYEGAFNAYNEAALVDEPITAERVLSGASWGLLYNVVGNVGAYGGAKILGAGARGIRRANDAVGLFKRAGSEVAAATEAVPKAGFSEFINPGEAGPGESTLQYPDKMELASDDGKPGFSRIGYNRPTGTFSPDVAPILPDNLELAGDGGPPVERQSYPGTSGKIHDPSIPEPVNPFGTFDFNNIEMGENPGQVRAGIDTNRDLYATPQTKPIPKETPPVAENVATKMAKTIDKKKAEALTRQFHENEKALNQKRIELDSAKEGSKAEKKLLDQISKHETLSKKYADELDGIKQESAPKEPSKPEEVEDHLFDYGDAKTTKLKTSMWRRSLHALMSEEGLKQDALFKSLGKRAAAAQQAGDEELAAKLFEQKELVGKQIDNMHPDFVDPKTGKVMPGYRSHMREYGRLVGNDASLAPDLKYREMTPVEKEALHREIATNPEAFPIDKEGLPEVKPTEKTQLQAGAEAEPPKQVASVTPRPRIRTLKDARNAWRESGNRLADLKAKIQMALSNGVPPENLEGPLKEYEQAKAVHKANLKTKGPLEKFTKRLRYVKEQLSFLKSLPEDSTHYPEGYRERAIPEYEAELKDLEKNNPFKEPAAEAPKAEPEKAAGDLTHREKLGGQLDKLADDFLAEKDPVVKAKLLKQRNKLFKEWERLRYGEREGIPEKAAPKETPVEAPVEAPAEAPATPREPVLPEREIPPPRHIPTDPDDPALQHGALPNEDFVPQDLKGVNTRVKGLAQRMEQMAEALRRLDKQKLSPEVMSQKSALREGIDAIKLEIEHPAGGKPPKFTAAGEMDPSGDYLGEPAVEEPRATPEAPPKYSLQGDAPSGEPGQVIDRNGKSLEEHAAEAKANMKPELGDYQRAVKRGTFWRAHWIAPGPLKHIVHAGAVLNEIGPFVLNHVDPFVEAVNRIARASESNLGRALKAAVTATASHATSADYVDHNKLWKQNQQLITQLKANPQALTDGINNLLGPAAADHPKFVGQLVQGAAAATTAVSNQLPRNPQPPTPRDNEFNPPQSVKRRFNRLMRATMDPADVVRNPDPETWAIVQQVHPETAKYVQNYMMGVVTNPKIHLTRQQARRISILLGAPVTPANAPEFLKSMHESATIMAAPNPPQPGGGSNGPKSAKTGQQVLSLTATPEQNHQLGL